MKDGMTRTPLESYGLLREFIARTHPINFHVKNLRGFMDSYTQLGLGFSGRKMDSPPALVQTMDLE